MKLSLRTALLLVGAVFLLIMMGQIMSSGTGAQHKRLELSEFMSRIDTGDIGRVVIRENDIRGFGKSGEKNALVIYHAFSSDKTELIRVMREKNISFTEQGPSAFDNLLAIGLQLLPILFLIFLFVMLTRGAGSQMSALAKQTKSIYTRHDVVRERFTDVAGIDEAVEEVREIVDFLGNPRRFTRLGGKIPKGILLVGPSGTGKTLLARAIAGEASVPFFKADSSAFVQMFVGVGAGRVRDLFNDARKSAPCIVFMDEFDAVAKSRAGINSSGTNDEREQTLNQLLVEMDGFVQNEGVVVMAATNRPEILDPAALRPGRFDRHVEVPKPDLRGREAILNVHAKNKPLAEDVDLVLVARGTPGMTGADLEQLLNEAALHAAKRDSEKIERIDIDYAIYKVILGPERKSALLTDNVKRIVAYHESGHAIVGWMLPYADPVLKVTIIPRRRALGLTLSLPAEDRVLASKNELLDQITMMLGGRAAEEIIAANPDDITSGASNDFEQATQIAGSMVKYCGMASERFGLRALGRQVHSFLGNVEGAQDYSDATAELIDEEIKRILDERHARAKDLLKEHKEMLDRLAAALIEHETLDVIDLERILGPRPKKP